MLKNKNKNMKKYGKIKITKKKLKNNIKKNKEINK